MKLWNPFLGIIIIIYITFMKALHLHVKFWFSFPSSSFKFQSIYLCGYYQTPRFKSQELLLPYFTATNKIPQSITGFGAKNRDNHLRKRFRPLKPPSKPPLKLSQKLMSNSPLKRMEIEWLYPNWLCGSISWGPCYIHPKLGVLQNNNFI